MTSFRDSALGSLGTLLRDLSKCPSDPYVSKMRLTRLKYRRILRMMSGRYKSYFLLMSRCNPLRYVPSIPLNIVALALYFVLALVFTFSQCDTTTERGWSDSFRHHQMERILFPLSGYRHVHRSHWVRAPSSIPREPTQSRPLRDY